MEVLKRENKGKDKFHGESASFLAIGRIELPSLSLVLWGGAVRVVFGRPHETAASAVVLAGRSELRTCDMPWPPTTKLVTSIS